MQVADSVAHFLERFHLIPRRLSKVVCDRWERAIWAEFDTSEAEIDQMMADGEPVTPEIPYGR